MFPLLINPKSVSYGRCYMKKFWPTIIAIIIVIGVGCFAYPRQETPMVPDLTPPPPSTAVSDLFGVIKEMDSQRNLIKVLLPDGGLEEVIYSSDAPIQASDLGLLIKVSGERELSTRQITAKSLEIIDSPSLFVTSPEPGATVTSPIIVFGFGRVFEQTFSWRILDSHNEIAGQGHAMTSASDLGKFGAFRLEIFLPVLTDKSFTMEIYEASPRDGSELYLVSVPLKLLSTNATTIDVYFSNDQLNSLDDCSLVYPVSRTMAQTSAVGRAALLELLAGPTPKEQAQGYFTQIPSGTSLNSLSITNGSANADFSFPSHSLAGSCRVSAVREQISNTLMQFSSVQSVDILEDGQYPASLEP